jgi:hypothetical protein
MGVISSSRSSGIVAIPGTFAPTPTLRREHWFDIVCNLLAPLIESIPHILHPQVKTGSRQAFCTEVRT